MKSIEQNLLKKSLSLYSKTNRSFQQNPEQQARKLQVETHLEQLILQKYNFSSKLQNELHPLYTRKRCMNTTIMFPSRNMILVNKLPEINHSNPIQNEDKIKDFKSINANKSPQKYPFYSYDILQYKKRKVSEYKQCKNRIQMNTTYRGFNLNKEKLYQEKRLLAYQQANQINNQIDYSNPIKPAQRKLIINYIIQKGYAKRKQQELNKFRNEKKKNYQSNLSSKKPKVVSPFRVKRSVIFSKSNIFKTQTEQQSLKLKPTEQSIQPW